MSFWHALKSCNGPSNFEVTLHGEFIEAVTLGGCVGEIKIYTYKHANPTGYVLTNIKLRGNKHIESENVYVLAYDEDGITEVTFEELRDYEYFVTSEFSGCRFVVTDEGVSHVSWSAGRPPSRWCGSQAMRDIAEAGNMERQPTQLRRLSITAGTSVLEKILGENGTAIIPSESYKLKTESVMMFGYQENGIWHFKMLKYRKGRSSGSGIWSTFVSVIRI